MMVINIWLAERHSVGPAVGSSLSQVKSQYRGGTVLDKTTCFVW